MTTKAERRRRSVYINLFPEPGPLNIIDALPDDIAEIALEILTRQEWDELIMDQYVDELRYGKQS
jgi:hypothetical protein